MRNKGRSPALKRRGNGGPPTPPSKLVLFGAGQGARDLLALLVEAPDIRVVSVVPRLNRQTGEPENSQELAQLARQRGVPILAARNINDGAVLAQIRALEPSLVVNWGHGQIFGRGLLDAAPLGVLNVHPGLLPAGRGSGALVGEIWNGSTRVGQSVHFMDEHLDRGRVVLTRSFEITGYEYQDELNERLMRGAPEFVVEGIRKALAGVRGEPVSGFGRYYPKFIAGDDIVDWNQTSDFLLRRIRSRSPFILSRAFRNPGGREILIRRVSPATLEPYFSPVGQVIDKSEQGILVKTRDTAIWIEEVSEGDDVFRRPDYPIGTSFVANWLQEYRQLSRRVEELSRELGSLKASLGGIAPPGSELVSGSSRPRRALPE